MKTIEAQTGWKRPFPKMICQEHNVLNLITEYDFNMDDQKFIAYFRSRTGIQLGLEDKPELAKFLLTSPKAEQWLLNSPDFKYLNGLVVPLQKRKNHVKTNKILKGRLQDCWELYHLTGGANN